jgi:hypothetical protein
MSQIGIVKGLEYVAPVRRPFIGLGNRLRSRIAYTNDRAIAHGHPLSPVFLQELRAMFNEPQEIRRWHLAPRM